MPALQLDITIEAGVAFQRLLTVKKRDADFPDDRTKDTDFDFAGYSGVGELKNKAGQKLADFTVTLSTGQALFALDDATASGLFAAGYPHSYIIKATHPSLPDYRLAQGKALVSAE